MRKSGGKQVEEDLHQGAGLYPGPYFDNSLTKIVRARKGSHAYLSCRVHQLDNKSVSWVRRKDAHIISVGESSFIQDPRFRVYHFPRDHMWTLQIQDVRPEDSGEYECQISTEPKRSFLVLLKVLPQLFHI
ncbi:unnamed protein product [Darwinula stevensoni]|uniref:Ig-like domain-containing protein n=1 Tax=Darwinula stevensoni TaxID=69355 RepID=A0A7R9FPU2_9CRUS|nr:unnamed protein product [Darwinula stevensoni]CAG0898140.1 unnamed protein product [Darwinula stevensoni]